MKYIDRNGRVTEKTTSQDKVLSKMYNCVAGRMIFKVAVNPVVSKAAGVFLDSRYSKFLIKKTFKKNPENLMAYEKQEFDSYNDYFCRKRKDKADVEGGSNTLISPADSKLSVYEIKDGTKFTVKNTAYDVRSLLRDEKLADKYKGGYALVFRLTTDDYHHYIWPADGFKGRYRTIPGVFHTVNPVSGDYYPVYKENTRQYCVIKSVNFGFLTMIEVGALFVGRIVNENAPSFVVRGSEKGHFEFGGSSIIILTQKDKLVIREDLMDNTKYGAETIVKLGESIGKAI